MFHDVLLISIKGVMKEDCLVLVNVLRHFLTLTGSTLVHKRVQEIFRQIW